MTRHKKRKFFSRFLLTKRKVVDFQSSNQPVISVDSKKKELVGRFANGGREYQPKGKPEEVETYDFPSLADGKGIPYGVYDMTSNQGWVSVGTDHDTAQFAVQSIRQWWCQMGLSAYPEAKELLITADGGGSNGSRNRLWKLELQRFVHEAQFVVTVCHFKEFIMGIGNFFMFHKAISGLNNKNGKIKNFIKCNLFYSVFKKSYYSTDSLINVCM